MVRPLLRPTVEIFYIIIVIVSIFIFFDLIMKKLNKPSIIFKLEEKINNFPKFEIFIWIFAFFYALGCTFLMNLWNTDVITQDDYAVLFMQNWFLETNPNSMFNIFFNSGFNSFIYSHPGLNYLIAMLSKIGIPLWLSFRFLIFFTCVSSYIFPYYLCRKLGFSKFSAFFAGFYGTVGISYLFLVSAGMYPFLFGCMLSIMCGLELKELFRLNSQKRIEFILKISIFLGFILYVHTLSLFLVILLNINPLIKFLKSKPSKSQYISILSNLLIIGIIMFLIGAGYIIPLFSQMIATEYFASNNLPDVYNTTALRDIINFQMYELYYNFSEIISSMLFVSGIVLYLIAKYKKKPLKSIIWSYFYLGIFLFTMIGLSYVYDANIIVSFPFRYLILVDLTGGVFVCYAVDRIIKDFKKKKKYIPSSFFILIILFPLTTGLYNHSTIDSTEIKPYTQHAVDWINSKEINQTSRIIIENSDFITGQLWGGLSTSLIPYYTNEFVIGEVGSLFWVAKDSSFYDGNAFGKNISYYSIEEFEKVLNDNNIRYLIVHSNDSKNFLSQYNNSFSLVQQDGVFWYYEYLDAINSYIQSSNSVLISNLELFESDHVIFNIFNATQGDIVQISLNYEKNWKIFVNGSQLPINPNTKFINITIPENGDFVIELKWSYLLSDILSITASIITIFLVMVFILFQKMKQGKKMHINSKTILVLPILNIPYFLQ